MQDRPDVPTLLDAVAQFLLTELHGATADKRLAFRVLIAANLASVTANELRGLDARLTGELQRLSEILTDLPEAKAPVETGSTSERRARAAALNRALAQRIREGTMTPEQEEKAWDHAKRSLLEALAVDNPRFDTSDTID